jgi:hypothetical protein
VTATRFWSPVIDRVGAVIAGTYGTAHPVTAGVFSVDDTAAGLSQDGEPIAQRVRSVRVTPVAPRWTLGAANTRSGENSRTLRVEVRIGYRGDTDPPLTGTTPTEQARPEVQAVDDWDGVVMNALRRPENWVGLTPSLFNVEEVDGTSVESTPEGLVDLVAFLDLSVSFNPATVWALGG